MLIDTNAWLLELYHKTNTGTIMNLKDKSLAGTILFIGGIQWFLGLLLAESFFEGYSSRIDYVSDLGIGPTALIFNTTSFLLVCALLLVPFS